MQEFCEESSATRKFEEVQKMTTEGAKLIEEAETTFFKNVEQRLALSGASGKSYWKLLDE